MGSWAWLLPSLVCSPLVGVILSSLTHDRLNLSSATAVGTDFLLDNTEFG